MNYPLVQFLAFAAFIVLLVAVLSAGMTDQDSVLDSMSVGETAGRDIRATRTFSYSSIDVEATRAAEEAAAASVPPVFDWQTQVADQKRDQVSRAFASMRDGLLARANETTSSAPVRQPDLDDIPPDKLVAWATQLRPERFDPYFKALIPTPAFRELARHGFSQRTELALSGLLSTSMNQMLVEDVRPLTQDVENGVSLRRLRDQKVLVEYEVRSVDDHFTTISAVQGIIREFASDGNIASSEPRLQAALISAATTLAEPNTFFNADETRTKREEARRLTGDIYLDKTFAKGDVIVSKGQIITEEDYRVAQRMLSSDRYASRAQAMAGVAITVLLLVLIFFVFARRNIRSFRPGRKDIIFLATSLLLMLTATQVGKAVALGFSAQGLGPSFYLYFAIPVAAGGMLVRLVLGNEHAVVFTVVYSVLAGMIVDESLFFAVYSVSGTLVGLGTVQQVKHRLALMWSGLAVGTVNIALIAAYLLMEGSLFELESLTFAAMGFVSGVASGFGVLAVLPLVEAVFSYTTDIKLLEMANLNHPLLRELILRSPGSYHHSMMVGSLCEAAAEDVGANALLCRVGSYYHDVGKAKNPRYFAENQTVGDNPHDNLKPNMSALIIKAHVKDGIEMARQHRLPNELLDFIAQHHGTSLIAYFYHKAKEMEDPDIPEVKEKDYRYPGPKPQSRETAICMLADGTEAASRALKNPTPQRLKAVVDKIISKAFNDNQLDECDLTLQDLNTISKAFLRILTGIYHHRPEYPGERRPSTNDRGRATADASAEGEHTTNRDDSQATRHDRNGHARRNLVDTNEAKQPNPATATSDTWELSEEQAENLRNQRALHAGGDSDD